MAGPIPPNGSIRLVFGGPVSTQDSWTTSLWISVGTLAGTPSPAEMNAIALIGLNAMKTNIFASGKELGEIAAATSLTFCNAYFYAGSSSAASVQGVATTAAVVGTGSTPHPAYCAIVASLYTDTAGRSGKGRMYLPLTSMGITAGTLQWNGANTLLTNMKAFLDALVTTYTVNGVARTGFPCVYSRKLNVLNSVTQLRIDSIPDTQHGRLNKDVATTVATTAIP